MNNYFKSQFNNDQLKVIKECEESGYDPSSFARPELDSFKMRLAFHAIRNGNDLSFYLDSFNHEQLEEIRIGLLSGVDVDSYAITDLSADEMHMRRVELEDKLTATMGV